MNGQEKSVRKAWVFYDWANSAYSLVISTAVFPIYYGAVTATETTDRITFLGISAQNTVFYTFIIAFSYLLLAFVSPYLSALADVTGSKKRFMSFFIFLGSIACISLFFFTSEAVYIGLIGAFLASIGFAGSLVFYNAYLPEIAPPEDQDNLSARGFILGYLGSSLLLIALLAMIENYAALGFSDRGMPTRWAFVAVGLWWLGWSIYPMRKLPVNPYNRKVSHAGLTKTAYAALRRVFVEFSGMPRLGRFVGAFFFFSCGVQTTILIATLFGQKVLGLDSTQLIATVLIIQFVAMLGAWLFSRLSALIGNIKAIGVAVLVWMFVCAGAYIVSEDWHFYVIGGVVGLVLGGLQSLGRSTYSKMLPDTQDHATYFSFLDVAEKMAATIGMLSVGVLEYLTGDLRNASLALMIFFAISLIFLFAIPKSKYVY